MSQLYEKMEADIAKQRVAAGQPKSVGIGVISWILTVKIKNTTKAHAPIDDFQPHVSTQVNPPLTVIWSKKIIGRADCYQVWAWNSRLHDSKINFNQL